MLSVSLVILSVYYFSSLDFESRHNQDHALQCRYYILSEIFNDSLYTYLLLLNCNEYRLLIKQNHLLCNFYVSANFCRVNDTISRSFFSPFLVSCVH